VSIDYYVFGLLGILAQLVSTGKEWALEVVLGEDEGRPLRRGG